VDRRLAHQEFAPQVPPEYDPAYSAAFEKQLSEHADELAAVIVEPSCRARAACGSTTRGIS
jgi:adenosylmethionine-8-amino-7-oxononanoate aminotransferase